MDILGQKNPPNIIAAAEAAAAALSLACYNSSTRDVTQKYKCPLLNSAAAATALILLH